jgi:hypothetical protein
MGPQNQNLRFNCSATLELPIVHLHQPKTSRISCALSYAILLGGFLTTAVALYMVVTTYSSLQFWDERRRVEVTAKGSNPFSPVWL